jgi:hypothetical protein
MAPFLFLQARGILFTLLVGHKVLTVAPNIDAGATGDRASGAEEVHNVSSLAAFMEPVPEMTSSVHDTGAPVRSLALTTDWKWSPAAKLELRAPMWNNDGYSYEEAVGTNYATVCASLNYDSLTITNTDQTLAFSDFSSGRVKLVKAGSTRSTCALATHDAATGRAKAEVVVFGEMGLTVKHDGRVGMPLTLGGPSSEILSSGTKKINFMHGGMYRFCYTPDGTFGGGDNTENLVLQPLKVIGVASPCDDFGNEYTDGCIRKERWECYFGLKGESLLNCVFDFRGKVGRPGWALEVVNVSKMSWGKVFTDINYINGQEGAITEEDCGQIKDDAYDEPFEQIGIVSSKFKFLKLDDETAATFPPVKKTVTKAFTIAACYCPNYDREIGKYCADPLTCCDQDHEFIQMFGTVYYWSIRICDKDADDEWKICSNPYMRVIPQQQFVLRVECPPGKGCMYTDVNDPATNRVKFLEPSLANDLPNWDPNHGCRVQERESANAVWPSASHTLTLSGGGRQDYKAWSEFQVKVTLSLDEELVVCFANAAAETMSSWFRIGQVRTSKQFAFASESLSGQNYKHLQYVDHPGSITLYGGIRGRGSGSGENVDPYEGNQYSGAALINVLSFDREKRYGINYDGKETLEEYFGYNKNMPDTFQSQMDHECQKSIFSPTLVKGQWDLQGSQDYMAKIHAGVSRFQSFTGPSQQTRNRLSINEASVIGVCYCAMVSESSTCIAPEYWVFAGRTTIRGPVGGQEWIFPTHIVVNVALSGWGLSGCDKDINADCGSGGRDRLRIIDPNENPGENPCQGNPFGYQAFKLRRPESGGVLNDGDFIVAEVGTDIDMLAKTGKNTNTTLVDRVTVGPTSSIIHFLNPVTDVLQQGDMITIDPSTVLVSNTATVALNDNPKHQYDLNRFTGVYNFVNLGWDPGAVDATYWVSHKLSNVIENGVVNPSKMSIPVGWAEDPSFNFTGNEGHWTQRNKIESRIEIKGVMERSKLKACWGVHTKNGGTVGSTQYYKEAGELTFIDPPLMKNVQVDLTAKQDNVFAPVVITFETNDISAYSSSSGETQLMLRFNTIGSKLIPMTTEDWNPLSPQKRPQGLLTIVPSPDPFPRWIAPPDMRQWVCGMLFLELWREDTGTGEDDGFPVPIGCHYGPELQDNSTLPRYRELFLVFGPYAGLRQNSKYQLVINAETWNIKKGDELLELYAMCAKIEGCRRPYEVFERGVAISNSNTEVGATDNDVQWSSDPGGFLIQLGHPTSRVHLMSKASPADVAPNVLQFKLASTPAKPIKKNYILKVYMRPVTLWNLAAADCSATCIKYHGSGHVCTGPGQPPTVSCSPQEVIPGSGRRNIIKLTLPPEMDDIGPGSVEHTVRITGLTLPKWGFFPTRVGVEVRFPDETKPLYTTSVGFLMKDPERGMTEGRLVLNGRTGFGPKPFAGDTLNTLYVRLRVGSTIFHNGRVLDLYPATIKISLPEVNGYRCRIQTEDSVPDINMPVFQADSKPKDGYMDNPRGYLSTASDDGTWDPGAKECLYKVPKYGAIYAKQVIYVKIRLDNPQGYVGRAEAKNQWRITLSCLGGHPNWDTPFDSSYPLNKLDGDGADKGAEFIGAYLEGQYNEGARRRNPDHFWSKNAAVLRRLSDKANDLAATDPIIQPSTFKISDSIVSPGLQITATLRVFFFSGVTILNNGNVVLDAPRRFDFGETCDHGDLETHYYDFVGIGRPQLFKLNNKLYCNGTRVDQWMTDTDLDKSYYDRATSRVGGNILTGSWYGYTIKVKHPIMYDVMQQEDWFLRLEDSNQYPLQASYTSMRLTRPMMTTTSTTMYAFYHASYGLYENHASDIAVSIADMMPKTVTLADTPCTIGPIRFEQALTTSFRLTAPAGYTWSRALVLDPLGGLDLVEPVGKVMLKPPQFIEIIQVSQASFPPPVLDTDHPNVLVWESLYLEGMTTYGFTASINVPDFPPVTSSNAFILEWGYQEDKVRMDVPYRRKASIIEAPRIKTVTSAEVDFGCNLVSYADNYLQFTFRTITRLTRNQGVVIEGDSETAGFRFPAATSGTGRRLAPAWASVPCGECLTIPQMAIVHPLIHANGMPQIKILVGDYPMEAGLYMLEVPVQNPTEKVTTAPKWKIGTYQDITKFPSTPVIDKPINAEGFFIDLRINAAGLHPVGEVLKVKTGRNDRPGRLNNLIFTFNLKVKPTTRTALTVRGPRGFRFQEDCNPDVVVDSNEVFGLNSGASWPEEYMVWPTGYEPESCLGRGRKAELMIPPGLSRRVTYAFRIAVYNPIVTPKWNKWSLNYNGEASDPFAGFPIWTNYMTSVYPSTDSRSPTDPKLPKTENPVMIIFTPFNTLAFKPTQPQGAAPVSGGILRLIAPVGFEFVTEGTDVTNSEYQCKPPQLSLEDGSMIFYAKTEIRCAIAINKREITLENIAYARSKLIEGGKEYRLIVFVNNPIQTHPTPLDWEMDTYSHRDALPEHGLDNSIVSGFVVYNVLNTFAVTNVNTIFEGKASVDVINVLLQFPDPIKDGDSVIMTTPLGFDIAGNPATKGCKNFKWKEFKVAFPRTQNGVPRCECTGLNRQRKCTLRWDPILEFLDPVWQENKDIEFFIGTTNPSNTPYVTSNFWHIKHVRKKLIWSAAVSSSWSIKPQLENLDVALEKGKYSAGSKADLVFSFTPVTKVFDATIKIVAKYPYEFNFEGASASNSAGVIDPRSKGNTLIINRVPLTVDTPTSFRVNSVLLGRGGGQTEFDVQIFDGGIPQDYPNTQPVLTDEALNFKSGFRLPGRLTILHQILESKYEIEKMSNPVKSLFLPRVDEKARAKFTFRMTHRSMASEKLVIGSEGDNRYTLDTGGFVLYGTVEVSSFANAGESAHELQVDLLPGMPVTEVALFPDKIYTCELWCTPQAGASVWRIQTTAMGLYPTNTNDGESDTFQPVRKMELIIPAPRSPPGAQIDVELKINPNGAVIRELIIIAPPGFSFPPTGCGDMCTAGPMFGAVDRSTAIIKSPTGEPLSGLGQRRIKIITPAKTGDSITWYIQGKQTATDTRAAWGFGSGFSVQQMRNTLPYPMIMYPGVAGLRKAQITFKFTLAVDAGSVISVTPPKGFLLTCSLPGTLRQLSLPGPIPDCVDDPLELRLGATLTAGEYAFGLAADLPPATPLINIFNMIVSNQEGQVVDAAYELPGQGIVQVSIANPTLAWTKSMPAGRSQITFGITFTEQVIDILGLLLNFPDKFVHDINKNTDVQNNNKDFRVAPGRSWADSSFKNRLLIKVDDTQPINLIEPGYYSWTFPVVLPTTVMPRNNVWYFSLCNDEFCTVPGDRSVRVTMPMAGFAMGEKSDPLTLINTNAAVNLRRPRALVWAVLGGGVPVFTALFVLRAAPL